MHGEFPKQLLAKARGSTRRTIAITFVLLAIIGALYYVFGAPAAQQRLHCSGVQIASGPRGRYL